MPLGPTSFWRFSLSKAFLHLLEIHYLLVQVLCQKGYLEERDVELAPIFSCKKQIMVMLFLLKRGLFEKAHRRFQKKAFTADQVAFQKFCEKNSFWLEDYALFASLKDYFIAERQEAGFSNEFLLLKKRLRKNYQKFTKGFIILVQYGVHGLKN